MKSLDNIIKIFILTVLTCSCVEVGTDKGGLKFVTAESLERETGNQEEIPAPELEATYESVNFHLIQKSCAKCHNNTSRREPFLTKEDLLLNAEDIIDSLSTCDFVECMPPKGKAPIPTEEIIEAFKSWVEFENEPSVGL